MAKDGQIRSSAATLYELQQPEKLSNVMAEDRKKIDDCLSCRIMGKLLILHVETSAQCEPGAAAFGGLGAYSYYTGHQQLQLQRRKILRSGSRFGMKSRQAGITGISIILAGLGAWRLLN